MKQEQKEKKLRLGKITVEDLSIRLAHDEQQQVKGGIDNGPTDVTYGTTNIPVFC